MSAKVCLVVIFNHRYDRNLPILRERYRGTFSHVRYLVPFYQGTDADVIPVYESSANFQGYIAQSWQHLGGEGFSHYVYVADDMVLHPGLNEDNLLATLRLGPGDAYIQELRSITDVTFHWPFLHVTLESLRANCFVNSAAELPTREEAFRRLAAHGVKVDGFGLKTLRFGQGSWRWRIRSLLTSALMLYRSKSMREVMYPLAMGYSDFFAVPAVDLPEFGRLCGVFAAMRVFVECAIPTALALACRSIRLERDNEWRGLEVFHLGELADYERRYDLHLPTLLKQFPEKTIYVHPIKLSRWRLA